MKRPFTDHTFTKMIEGKDQPALAAAAAENSLSYLNEVKEKIYHSSGDEAVENVLAYRFVKRALEQIIEYCKNPSSSITFEDHNIYYSYAYSRLEKAEEIINKEFSYLNL